jgi:drug/metabolite transporter (DMT)-like permease
LGAELRAHHFVRMTFRKIAILALIVFCSTSGDFFLKLGMTQVGQVHWSHPQTLISALFNPWVALGTVVLIIFFVSFMDALTWADLSFVMPATALGYVLTALLSAWVLHERVSPWRWAGVCLIAIAVGLVAGGKAKTTAHGEAA